MILAYRAAVETDRTTVAEMDGAEGMAAGAAEEPPAMGGEVAMEGMEAGEVAEVLLNTEQ